LAERSAWEAVIVCSIPTKVILFAFILIPISRPLKSTSSEPEISSLGRLKKFVVPLEKVCGPGLTHPPESHWVSHFFLDLLLVLPKVVVISVKQFGKTRVIGAEFTQIGVKFSVTLKTLLKTGSFSVTFSDFTENGVTIDFQKSIGAQFGRFWSRLFWVFCMTVWVFSQ
jgi:hypothetical protein